MLGKYVASSNSCDTGTDDQNFLIRSLLLISGAFVRGRYQSDTLDAWL